MAQVIDPVCGMTVDTNSAQYTSDYEGTKFYFCGAGCKKAFDRDPAQYTGQAESGSAGDGGHSDHGGPAAL